jgi:hypothetical protein
MLQFILTNVFLISLGGTLYMCVRTLPRIEGSARRTDKRTVFERWVMSEIPHKIDLALNATMGKFFRKTKVVLMRIDNYLTERLKKIHTGVNGNGLTGKVKVKIDFNDLSPGNDSDEKENTATDESLTEGD